MSSQSAQKKIQNYREQLILPEIPVDEQKKMKFFSYSNLIATGYERVVIGERGPYIEFTDEQICKDNFHVPHSERWRIKSKIRFMAFYEEYRTWRDSIMIYHQLRYVHYADYIPGMWYISPWDLQSDGFPRLMLGGKPMSIK